MRPHPGGESRPACPVDSPLRGESILPDLVTRNAVIAAHLERLEAALEHTRSAARSLRDLLGRAEPLPTTIEHLAVPATAAAAIAATIAAGHDTIPWVLGAVGELRATLTAQDITVTGLAGGIYVDELFTEVRGEATLFLPCTGEIRAAGRVKSVIVPEAELATIVHAGPHTDLDRSYGALASWRRQPHPAVAPQGLHAQRRCA
jgi:effector-binding domain-containing protein